ncbi:MAG: glycosyltransferase family 4 protein [Planctomycetaceae bacterium]|nr:glycosyltransferase family 4 protein [Planctomycetaceae bacterium]
MRVLMLTHTSETPSTRHRILPLIPLFRRDGVDVEHVEIPSGLMDRWGILRRAPGYDVVLHQKRLLPPWQMRALRRRAKALVYDFDDPMIYSRDDGAVTTSSTRVSRFRAALAAADAVTCHAGSDGLARDYGAKNVHVVSTPVDLARWPMKTSWAASKPILGWLGSASNLPNLRSIAPALQGRTLRIVADRSIELPGVDVQFVTWDAATESEQVRAFDVALAPLPDDAWSRFKMPYKIVNYFASGVPVVATGLGAVSAVIRDGENGLLAGDWKAQIARLEDPALRERLGRAGRKTAEAEFTVEAAYARFKSLFASLVARP